MSDTKLKPCPFCGGEAEYCKGDWIGKEYWVKCTKCSCKTSLSNNYKKPIEEWNTRKPIDRIVEELEEQMNDAKNLWDDDEYYTGLANAYEYAIDIVKAGGIDKQPITCKDCRQYPCRNTNEALETCDEFEWW